ncbi:phage regulatory protein/antirepressor Ant [Devosia sp.]|uniref:phage regulatory protein/antirepressor Ant n=1 Tax=Devosia sp. TaxID=1871048 RepID=UPI002AFFB0EE|nr:phage regulatory protein/antirepressor Ant [Devosia sp.]
MNEIINTTVPATMTTREIAELCDKRHADVMRDCRTMFDALEIGESNFAFTYTDSQNKERAEYRLPRDLTMTLITGYSIPLRKKVLDRLDELERRQADPASFLNDPAAMRGLLLTYTEKVLTLEARVGELEPAKEALDRISEADGSLCVTDAAKALQMRPKDLFSWLRTNGWIYRRPGTSHDLGYQSKTTAGLLEHKITTVYRADGSEKITEQVRVTPKGLARLAALIKTAIGRAAA